MELSVWLCSTLSKKSEGTIHEADKRFRYTSSVTPVTQAKAEFHYTSCLLSAIPYCGYLSI